MTNDQVQSAEDPRVIRCLREYGLALQAGPRPPRQEILAQFPEIAEELSACLDGLEFIHHVAPQLGGASKDEADLLASQLSSVPLGDFRIVREIGRGGMGVVYEAEQMSLGRRVALKVLPFASVLDSRQLQRFKNEAQAAASLHHTHIVPVYSVGCERGVHYYAMEYIEGQTLAAVITGLRGGDASDPKSKIQNRQPRRSPAFRRREQRAARSSSARWPGWGWSRRHKPLVASISISTLTILLLAFVGLAAGYATIRGEQKRTVQALEDAKAGHAAAAAQREQADANRRQALAAMDRMLNSVSKEELGGMPQAEQVRRRVLEDALGFYKEFLQQRATDPLLRREMARTYQRLGSIYQQLGELGQAESALRRGLADFERLAAEHPRTAENHLGVADMYTDLATMLWEVPGREPDAENAHRRSVDALGRLLAQYPDARAYQSRLAQAQHDLGYFLGGMKRFAEAEEAYHLALAIVARQTAEFPHSVELRHKEATFSNSLGLLLRRTGRPREAERRHRRALSLMEEDHGAAVEEHDNQLARSLAHLALAVEQTGRRTEAEPLLRQALETRAKMVEARPKAQQPRSEMALTCAALAGLLARDQRPAEAEPLYQQAVDVEERLVHDFPLVPKHRGDLALILEKQGRLLMNGERAGEAQPPLRRALALREELASESPDVEELKRDLARSRFLSAIVCRRLGETEQAQECYDRAVEWSQAHPDDDAEWQAVRREAEEAMKDVEPEAKSAEVEDPTP